MPLDDFKREMAECGFDWVKEVGFVHIHVFEHRGTGQPLVVTAERGVVAAAYVEQARKTCRQLRGDAEPTV